ncbi:MAG TPA: metal-dependent phosphohydrolase [Nanoarchaeota archaeon]|nr:metal-dependent phosphohydrolase [Nanoarchaeota archaeon]
MTLDMKVLLEEGKKGCLSEATIESVRQEIIGAMAGIKRKGMDKMLKYMESSDFYRAPASTKFHGNYEGGLAAHSYLVYHEFDELLARHGSGLASESRIIAGICHDFCKIGIYRKNEIKKGRGKGQSGARPYYFDDEFPIGHGEKSLWIAGRYIEPTEKEALLIRWHMGGYDKNYEINEPMIKQKCPELVLLQSADRIVSGWHNV